MGKVIPMNTARYWMSTDIFKCWYAYIYIVSSVQFLSHVQLFANPWTAASQATLSITDSRSLLKLISIKLVMPSNHLILCCLLLLLPSIFPASGSFPMSQFFASGGQSIGASASDLPMHIQGCFPLRLTALVSLQSKGLSRVFSNTTVQKHQFFSAQSSLWSNSLISKHDYWKKHSFDYTLGRKRQYGSQRPQVSKRTLSKILRTTGDNLLNFHFTGITYMCYMLFYMVLSLFYIQF